MKKQDLAGRPVKEIKEIMIGLRLKSAENARLLQDISSSMGKSLLERRKSALTGVRETYNNITISGKDPKDVILELHSLQVEERIYADDIATMESPKNIAECIDRDLAICQTVLESKEAKAHTGR